MALSRAQQAILEKSRALGAGGQAVALTDNACRFLIGVIARDLGVSSKFRELPKVLPTFFGPYPINKLEASCKTSVEELFKRLVSLDPNADTYFACLATMHKARLKYERILEVQPLPTIDQVGPRGLLQFGTMNSKALTGFLLWRKWMFDIDNRAGQETGYLFEPIIAAAIGGVPAPAKKSPVKRRKDPSKGRQVDCIKAKKAYEFKIRVTIAASGQGRWREELDFPDDCKTSGYKPVLVVLDPTPNTKLTELERAFKKHGGEVYIGEKAWTHLEAAAGKTMGRFLKEYVHAPIAELIKGLPDTKDMPDLVLKLSDTQLSVSIDRHVFTATRARPKPSELAEADEEMPEDADEEIGGG